MIDWVNFVVFGIVGNFIAAGVGFGISAWKFNGMSDGDMIKFKRFIDSRSSYIMNNNTKGKIRVTQALYLIPTYSIYIYTVYVYNILRYSGLRGAIRSVVGADEASLIKLIKYNPNDKYYNK